MILLVVTWYVILKSFDLKLASLESNYHSSIGGKTSCVVPLVFQEVLMKKQGKLKTTSKFEIIKIKFSL